MPATETCPTLVHALLSAAESTPGKPHLILREGEQETRRSFSALGDEALRYAALYRRAGVGRGDVVLLFLRTRPDMLAAFYGAMLAGAVPSYMPCPSAKQHPALYWQSHRALFERIAPRAVLAVGDDADQMRRQELGGPSAPILTADDLGDAMDPAQIALPRPEDPALLQHSSGTTGLKKGVVLSHRAVMAQLAALATAIAATPDDIVATWLPVYHDMGLVACTLAPLVFGQTIVMLDPFAWSADPASLLDTIARHRATVCWLPNFALAHMTRAVRGAAFDLGSLRLINVCSEPARPETMAAFAARFALPLARIQVCYAMAETVLAATQTPLDAPPRSLTLAAGPLRAEGRARPTEPGETAVCIASCGRPVNGLRVVVRDGAGEALAERRVGEVTIAGDCLFDGYHHLPELTRERLPDGWLRTRDLGFMDGGELFVLGRADDLIIVHGRNIYAHEIEASANAVDGVKPGRLVALGVATAQTGSEEIVVVAEAEADPATARAVKEAVFQDTGFLIREARLVPPGWLVKTTSGKIARGANRDKYEAEFLRRG